MSRTIRLSIIWSNFLKLEALKNLFYSSANDTTLYYYNNNWQVLTETDADGTTQRWFIYGNYIDEVLLIKADSNDYYYAQDHLYSPAALINSSGSVVERYEYVEDPHWRDAYGNATIRDTQYAIRAFMAIPTCLRLQELIYWITAL